MKTILIQPFYKDRSSARNKELKYCLQKNLENPEIDQVIAIVDQPINIHHPKLSVIRKEQRPTYRQLFDIAGLNDGLNIVCNSDIFFLPPDIRRLKQVIWDNRVVSLSRWDIQKKGLPKHHSHRDSQDCWIFKGELKHVECDFKLGVPGCDNRIAAEIAKNYEIVNPSLNIKTYHYHVTKVHNYTHSKDTIPRPYKFLTICRFNDTKIKKILHVCLTVGELKPDGMIRALKKLGKYKSFFWVNEKDKHGIEEMNTRLAKLSDKFKPDIIFMQLQTPDVINVNTLSQLHGFVINWTGDVRQNTPQWMMDIGKGVDVTCFTNETDVKKMRGEGEEDEFNSSFLQIGYDKKIFKPKGGKWKVPEIIFMGNHYDSRFPLSKFRYDMAHTLRSHYGDRFMLCGSGWKIDTVNLNLQHEKESLAYRNCKIAINANHFDYKRFTSDRMFRIMGSGAFCLTKWYPGYEKDFIDGVHLRIFHNLEEMIYLINYYIEHEEERKKIAKAGEKHVKENFTWEAMVSHIKRISQIQYKKTFAPIPIRQGKSRLPSIAAKDRAREARIVENEKVIQYEGCSKKLSILIPTLEQREFSFMKLLASLVKQINQNGLGKEIEVKYIPDRGKEEKNYMSIGKKRNDLLSISSGEFICFIDDDDEIHENYVKLLYEAITDNPDVDCITFNGWITFDGKDKQEYNFGLQYKEYNQNKKGIFTRPPGHLTPIRRDIAIKYKFKEFLKGNDRGSDVQWSMDLCRAKVLKTSVHIDEQLYHYLYKNKK